MPDLDLPGVHAAPNIQTAPEVYEIENQALDPEGRIEAAIWRIAPWAGKVVLDIGAGTGFHIPRFHEQASHVIAVEPHGPSRVRAMRRVANLQLDRASVMTGSAERLLLPDASVDIAHARFAYFFAPDCAPGIAELRRVIRPGGAAFIIDNDLEQGTFASWLRRTSYFAQHSQAEIDQFWADHGFACEVIPSEWRFTQREDLEAVMRNEFPAEIAEKIIMEHEGLSVDYVYRLFWRQFP